MKTSPKTEKEYVILLHGLKRSPRSMRKIEQRLKDAGYNILNIGYPSTKMPIELLVDKIHHQIKEKTHFEICKLNFVTHSMGGILARCYLKRYGDENVRAIVMIAPPNQGTPIVDILGKYRWFKFLYGKAGLQLGTQPHAIVHTLAQSYSCDVGIIAGNASINPIGAWLIGIENDGTVSVSSTQLKTMTDFIVLNSSHSFILMKNETCRQILYFLKEGKFQHL